MHKNNQWTGFAYSKDKPFDKEVSIIEKLRIFLNDYFWVYR